MIDNKSRIRTEKRFDHSTLKKNDIDLWCMMRLSWLGLERKSLRKLKTFSLSCLHMLVRDTTYRKLLFNAVMRGYFKLSERDKKKDRRTKAEHIVEGRLNKANGQRRRMQM